MPKANKASDLEPAFRGGRTRRGEILRLPRRIQIHFKGLYTSQKPQSIDILWGLISPDRSDVLKKARVISWHPMRSCRSCSERAGDGADDVPMGHSCPRLAGSVG